MWADYFTGELSRGPAVASSSVPLERMPVFVRAGAVYPAALRRPAATSAARSGSTLDVYPARPARSRLYEDEGDGLAYKRGRAARTRFSLARSRLTLGAAKGSFAGMPRARTYALRIHGVRRRPARVTLGSRKLTFAYDAATKTLTATTPSLATARAATVSFS